MGEERPVVARLNDQFAKQRGDFKDSVAPVQAQLGIKVESPNSDSPKSGSRMHFAGRNPKSPIRRQHPDFALSLDLQCPACRIDQFWPRADGPRNSLGSMVVQSPETDEDAFVRHLSRFRHLLSILTDHDRVVGQHNVVMSKNSSPNTLSHFAINVEDCDRAMAFYESVFGWQFHAWGPPGFHMTQVGDLHAAIQKKQDEPFPTLVGNFECTIAVDDVDQTVAMIVASGGEVTLPKVTIPNIADIARVKDTEGNTFSVARYL